MAEYRHEADKLLEAIDVVCLNCVEDTLNDESICEKCPVRRLSDSLCENENKDLRQEVNESD